MRTHRAKSAHLPAEYIPPTFWLEAPSPSSAGSPWGLLSRKIFFYFYFSDSLVISQDSVLRIIFLFFLRLRSYSDSYSILFRISVVLTRYKFCSIFTRLRFSYSLLIFDSHQFRLVSALHILCFDSSTLYLFNSSTCYKQTFMLIWVCFMLILAILRLSDVFSSVLDVVYRLGLK